MVFAIEEALGGSSDAVGSDAPDPFSLADPAKVERVLDAAGFTNVTLTDVQRPISYGRDVETALDWVHGFTCTKGVLARLGTGSAERVRRLQETLVAHATGGGVWFDSRAWIVKARRR